jgi:hypothetical protein
MLMKRTLVRYKTRPDMAQENERLIEKVFQELQAKSPQDVRYLALRLGRRHVRPFLHGRER